MGKHRPPNRPDDDRSYDVGYRSPPKHSRFQVGEGGNRKGRRRKVQNSLLQEIQEVLSQRIKVRHGGKIVTMSVRRAILHAHAAKAIQGNARSTDLLMKLNQPSPEDTDADLGRRLTAEDLTILSQLKNEIAAGNKTIDGSYPDEPTEYKEPTK